jgi:organic radical activating enzyme
VKTYQVKEIFGPTIQGEGSYSGTAVVFLRFAGCNRWSGRAVDKPTATCWFCDTDFKGGTKMTAGDIIRELEKLGSVRTLVISGGEPTLQLDAQLLIALKHAGFHMHLETNGSRPLGVMFDFFDHVTMSPKQAREETKLEKCHDVKLLYPPPIPDVTPEAFIDFPCDQRWLQPVWDEDVHAHELSACAYISANPMWRLSLQTHKIIGVK